MKEGGVTNYSAFIDYTDRMNRTAIERQGMKETVSHYDAAMAAAYIRDIAIMDVGDALVFCAALNLLNTYVKQKDAQIGYHFKEKLGYYLAVIINTSLEGVEVDLQLDKGSSLVVTQIGNVQFSFHNVKVRELKSLIKQESILITHLEWDGIRKQQCATTVFQLAIENREHVSNQTYRGKSLSARVEKTVNNYQRGVYTINQILFE